MSMDAVPSGKGLTDVLSFLSDKHKIMTGVKLARTWVHEGIRAVREAADPNPYRCATDEEIAGEILRQIENRRK
jgi:hypothetical protein